MSALAATRKYTAIPGLTGSGRGSTRLDFPPAARVQVIGNDKYPPETGST